MANAITVRTQITFSDNDGTTYNYDNQYYSDANTTASLPRRLIVTASDQGEAQIANFGASVLYDTHLTGASLVLIINRETSREVRIRKTTGADEESRVIPPGGWAFFDINEMDQQALGGGGSFTYGATAVTSITCMTNYQSAKIEALIIYKAAS